MNARLGDVVGGGQFSHSIVWRDPWRSFIWVNRFRLGPEL
jgi:hypothetical protein